MSLAAIGGWFDPRGRLSRRAYVRLILRLLLLFIVALCVVIGIAALGLRALSLVLLACPLGLSLVALAQTVRRLHDRDRSASWLTLYLALLGLNALPIERAVDTHPVLVAGYALASLVFSLWFFVETLGRPGTVGSNRYGPEPASAGLGTQAASMVSPQ